VANCPNCGEQNPDRARFCLACAAPLTTGPAQQAERKVVSVIFVDLVGFTAESDAADPEDVHATLKPYHARVRDEIERLGGVVEKYVGDAVMAVFGAPVAHEDDAERAVRVGLKVLEATEELGLEARAAVNTGEALVALGARPERGEALVAGDVVNTASRLQGAAETGTLVVGEPRLLRELGQWLDDEPDIVYWRQGRCLPYGEGITFWALGEIVKAQAGILESDETDAAAAKLAASVEGVVPEVSEQEWIRARLAPLLGISADGARLQP